MRSVYTSIGNRLQCHDMRLLNAVLRGSTPVQAMRYILRSVYNLKAMHMHGDFQQVVRGSAKLREIHYAERTLPQKNLARVKRRLNTNGIHSKFGLSKAAKTSRNPVCSFERFEAEQHCRNFFSNISVLKAI